MRSRRTLFPSLAVLAAVALPAAAIEITLPVETAQLRESPLPGYPLAVAMCQTCHSADYVQSQPVSSRAWWKSNVVKMQKTFGAPIPEEVIDPIVDYLARTYGSERPAATSAVAPGSAARATGSAAASVSTRK